MELQKVQHNIQYALNKRRGSSGSHSPTALLEQMEERLQSIAQDMYILNKSCGEEIVCSSLARARHRKSSAERGGTEGDLSNRFVATPLRSRFPQQTRLLSNGSALGSTKDHHPVSHHTHQIQHLLPPSHHRFSLQQQDLSPHHLSQVWHRFLVCSPSKRSFSNDHTRPVRAPALLNTRKFRIQDPPHTRRRHSQTDQRSRRLRSEQPGLRDDRRPEPAYLGLACGISGPASPATANVGKFQETAAAETTAQGAQGIPSLWAVRPSCRHLHGVYRWRSHCSMWCRSTEVRCRLQTVWDSCVVSIARFVSSVGPSGRSGVAGATPVGSILLSVSFALGTPFRTDDSLGIRTQRPAVRQPVSNSLRAGSQRTSGRQPAAELPHPRRRSD